MDENNQVQWLNEQLKKLHSEVLQLRLKEKKLEKVEEELSNYEKGFKNIFYELPFPIEVFDSIGYSVFVNRSFLEMCRIPSAELILRKYNLLKDRSIKENGFADEVKAVFSGEIVFLSKIEINFAEFRQKFGVQRKDEGLFDLTMFPVYNTKGEIFQVAVIWKDLTQLYNDEKQLNLFTTALNAAVNGIVITNKDGNIVWVNESFSHLTGYSENEVFYKNPKIWKSGKQNEEYYKKLWDTILAGKVWTQEIINKKKDGELYNELETITPVKNSKGVIKNFIAIKTDVTEQKKTEIELKRLNRALKTISACNSVLIRSSSESELVDEICKIIIEVGGYYFTWIGLLNSPEEKFITPAASYGHNEGYLNVLVSSLKEGKNLSSPFLRAISEKKVQITKNIFESNDFALWKDEALKRGYASAVFFPLTSHDMILGALCIYSNIVDRFNDEEIKLLEELADDISFGLFASRMKVRREKTEAELRKSEKRYRSLFEEDIAGHYITTPDGKILDCNSSFLKIFDFNSIEEAKNFDANKFYSSVETRELFVERIKREKRIKGLEFQLTTASGNKIYIIENVWGTFDDNGGLIEIKGYVLDNTQRKLTELALINSESKYRDLVENINEVIYSVDLSWNVTYISPAILKFSGYSPEDIIGKPFLDLFFQQDIPGVKKNLNASLLGSTESNECRIITKSSKIRWVKYSGYPIIRDDEIIGLQGVLTDITEIKEVEENLISAKEKAEEADKLKTEFLAQMSHEIRTPVNIMLSYNSMLKDELIDAANKEWDSVFNSIEFAGKRLIRTIDLILNMSMIQSGKIEISLVKIDINSLLRHLLNEYDAISEDKGVEFSLSNLSSSTIIESDEYIVNQVFQNLIDNALKYTKAGKVEIIVYKSGENKLCVDIKDTGIGISTEYLSQMFKPFSQEDTGYSRKYEGVGLGLALVKNYLDLIRASISVESEKGKGSVFTIVFN